MSVVIAAMRAKDRSGPGIWIVSYCEGGRGGGAGNLQIFAADFAVLGEVGRRGGDGRPQIRSSRTGLARRGGGFRGAARLLPRRGAFAVGFARAGILISFKELRVSVERLGVVRSGAKRLRKGLPGGGRIAGIFELAGAVNRFVRP